VQTGNFLCKKTAALSRERNEKKVTRKKENKYCRNANTAKKNGEMNQKKQGKERDKVIRI